MTTAYEAYTVARRGRPYRVGVIELVRAAEEMWTPAGVAAPVASFTVIATDAGIHLRARGTDRAHLVAVVDRLAAAVQAGHEMPTDDLPGAVAGEPESEGTNDG